MAAMDRIKCFVIMPFAKTSKKHTKAYWTKHYKEFLKPLIETNHQLVAVRSEPLRADILRQIIADLVTAPIVVADITDANPNVYWELGVRLSFKHGTVTIAEQSTDIPFDIGTKGTLFYHPDDYIEMEAFRKDFSGALEDCLKNPDIPDSPVLETISGRGTLYQIITRSESLRKLDALLSEITDNKDILRLVMDTCEKNIKIRKLANKERCTDRIEYTSARFRVVALETLIINRYIDAEDAFYQKMEECMIWLLSFKDALIDWPARPEPIEEWMTVSHKQVSEYCDMLKKQIAAQKKKLSNIT